MQLIGQEINMRCNQCGREIRSGEDLLMTTVDDEQIHGESALGATTRMRPLVLCSACSARRSGTELRFLWMIVAIVAGLLLIGLVLSN